MVTDADCHGGGQCKGFFARLTLLFAATPSGDCTVAKYYGNCTAEYTPEMHRIYYHHVRVTGIPCAFRNDDRAAHTGSSNRVCYLILTVISRTSRRTLILHDKYLQMNAIVAVATCSHILHGREHYCPTSCGSSRGVH
jgi:hypothetical protein